MKYEEQLYSEDTAKIETCDSPSSHACSAKDRAREVVERTVHEQFGQQVRPYISVAKRATSSESSICAFSRQAAFVRACCKSRDVRLQLINLVLVASSCTTRLRR
jgi:hypothetical protein